MTATPSKSSDDRDLPMLGAAAASLLECAEQRCRACGDVCRACRNQSERVPGASAAPAGAPPAWRRPILGCGSVLTDAIPATGSDGLKDAQPREISQREGTVTGLAGPLRSRNRYLYVVVVGTPYFILTYGYAFPQLLPYFYFDTACHS